VKNGDRAGLEDIEAALRLSLERGFGQVTTVTYINYADCVWFEEGPARGLELHRMAQEFGTRRGVLGHAVWSQTETLWMLFDQGRWDEVLDISAVAMERDAGTTQIGTMASSFRALVLVRRGQVRDAAALVDAFLPQARNVQDPQVLSPALFITAEIRLAEGDRPAAAELLSELVERTHEQPFWTLLYLADIARAAVGAGDVGPAKRFLESAVRGPTRHGHGGLSAKATLAEADGELEGAAALFSEAVPAWESYGGVVEAAMANLGAGRTLAALGRHDDADGPLRAAAATFSDIGATPLLAEAEALLAPGTAVSS
jgi:tetratricopeptide (TPR) repeat protein